jgi:hypothetical protein
MHRSASGVDLPMKVVDMIEAGLPAAVLDYGPCLAELVPPPLGNAMFGDAATLAARLEEAMEDFPASSRLKAMRVGLLSGDDGITWSKEWCRAVLPVIAEQGAVARKSRVPA